MKWLLQKTVLGEIRQRLEAGTRLLLFINYDSVLSKRALAPGTTALESSLRDKLRELSDQSSLTLVLVSDHSLVSLKKMVGFSGIYFIANHGLEIFGPDLNVVHAEAKRLRHTLGAIVQSIQKKVHALPGITCEDRDLSLALHLGDASPAHQRQAHLSLEELWTPVMDKFTLEERHHQLMLRPRVGWSKGRAVMFLWNKFATARRRPLVIYLGTGESEEDIFKQMGQEGMGVVVGGSPAVARFGAGYYLKTRGEIIRMISWLLQNASRPANHATATFR